MEIEPKKYDKPTILNFFDFKEEHQKFLLCSIVKIGFQVNCLTCIKPYRSSIKVTSNWITHIRSHPAEYQKYLDLRKQSGDRKQSNIPNFFKTHSKYAYTHPFQKRIDNQLVRLIVNTTFPLQVVEHYDFRYFCHLLNKQYRCSSKYRVTNNLIPSLFNRLKTDIKTWINKATTCAVTVDAWSDPRMKSHLAITCHMITDDWKPKSFLLDCIRFRDSHTGINIKSKYDEILAEFDILSKVSHVVTDNAANMICAFKKTSFIQSDIYKDIIESSQRDECTDSTLEILNQANEEYEMDNLDDATCNDYTESESTDANECEQMLNASIFDSISEGSIRLSCIAHTLQLVIKDALTDVSSVERAIETVARLIASTNKSNILKEKMENMDKFFTKRNVTRWSSQFNMVKSFLNFNENELEMLFERKNVITHTQRLILTELVLVLEDFAVITEMIQSDKFSIGHILPLIRGLINELTKSEKLKYCEKIRTNLLASLKKRFEYLENSPIYAIAAILTPSYGKKWLKPEEEHKWDKVIVTQIEEFVKKYGCKLESRSEIKEPLAKKLKVLNYLNEKSTLQTRSKSIECDLNEYLSQITKLSDMELETDKFWCLNEQRWPELASFAKFILSVPATSAPVERIFSVGSSILRPSRRCLKDDVFRQLMFLKCNLNLFNN